MTGHAILTPLLMVIIMLTGDLLAMSLTVDNVEASRVPNVWNIGNVTIAAIAIGSLLLLYYVGMLGFAQFELRLPTEGIRTMTFLLLVFGGQSTLYAVRQRHHLFKPFPNHWLIVSSVADLSIASFLAIFGIAMAPLSVGLVGATLAASVACGLVINVLKIPLFAGSQLPDAATRRPH
jgi:H+-transporting ATPase